MVSVLVAVSAKFLAGDTRVRDLATTGESGLGNLAFRGDVFHRWVYRGDCLIPGYRAVAVHVRPSEDETVLITVRGLAGHRAVLLVGPISGSTGEFRVGPAPGRGEESVHYRMVGRLAGPGSVGSVPCVYLEAWVETWNPRSGEPTDAPKQKLCGVLRASGPSGL